MDAEIRTLLENKLAALAREQTGELMTKVDPAWKKVNAGPNCIWIGDLTKEVRLACSVAIAERGTRVAALITETLRTVKVPYEERLSAELGKLLDPLFSEDLYLAPVTNTRGVHERRGNPQRFDQRVFESEFMLARVTSANGSRSARAKAQLAIDEYVLSIKPLAAPAKTWRSRIWDALNIRLGAFGVALDLKRLFSRKPPTS